MKVLILVILGFIFLMGIISAEQFGYNYLEEGESLTRSTGGGSSSSSSGGGGGNTSAEIQAAVNISADYIFGANTSEYWDGLDSPNSTQMENSGGYLNILESWLLSLFYSEGEVDDLISAVNITYYADEYWLNINSTKGINFNDTKLATIYYNATQASNISGIIDGETTLFNTQHQDGDYDGITFNFTEQVSAPALDLRVNFTGIDSFNGGVMRYKTSSLAGDYPIIQLWNYDTSAWEDYPSVGESSSFSIIAQQVYDYTDHVSDGIVQMRIYKAGTGNTNNHYYVDWIAISKGYGTPAGEETDPYAVHRDGSTPLTANWDAGQFNITLESIIVNNSICNSTACFTLQELNTSASGDTDTNCSDSSCAVVFYWTNASLLNETDLLWSVNTTENIQNILNSTGIYSTYNATYALYNDSAINTTANIQGLLNATGIYSTYNATYNSYAYNVSLNYTKIVFDTYNSTWDDGGSVGNESWNESFARSLFAPNTTLGLQILLNTTGIYSTYNATYSLYNDTDLILSVNTTENIQNLLNDTGIYDGDTDTNCSDSSCGVVFYWANVSLVNETARIDALNTTYSIEALYNSTASIITNITGNIINTTANIQGLLNATGIYSTYNATYDAKDNCNVTGSCNNITYLDYNNKVGNFNISGNMSVFGHSSFGVSSDIDHDFAATGAKIIYIGETWTDADYGITGLYLLPMFNPDASTSKSGTGIGGYIQTAETDFGAGSRLMGLDFGTWWFGANKGSTNLELIGVNTFGGGGAFTSGTAKDVFGIKTRGYFDGFGSTLTAGNVTALYIQDSVANGGSFTVTNNYGLQIDRLSRGTNKYQAILWGSGAGTGIWFNSTTGPRIYASNNSDLYFSTALANFSATVSAVTYIDRSTEYDKASYGEASQYLDDVSSRTDDTAGDVEYNHEADPEFLQYSYSYPCNCSIEEQCNEEYREFTDINGVFYNGTVDICEDVESCDTCSGIGRDIGGTISWLRQVNYEQKVRIDALELEINTIKTELCKGGVEYSFC